MTRSFRSERGQAMALPLVGLVAILAMAAFVIDVGSWMRADRAAQALVDSAVLAGAQALPHDPGTALSRAQEYADKNGGGSFSQLTVESAQTTNDTISARVERQAPGIFARVLGVNTVTVGANASARASTPAAARWVAPIVVSESHDLLNCTAPGVCHPEFNVNTTIDLMNLHKPGSADAAGAFGLINLVKGSNGSVGESELAEWVRTGFSELMETGTYNSVPSAMFNAAGFRSAINERITAGTELYFPVYRTIVNGGATAEYEIVGWIPFVITKVIGGGDAAQIEGYFKSGIVEGVPSDGTTQTPDFGAFTVSLTK